MTAIFSNKERKTIQFQQMSTLQRIFMFSWISYRSHMSFCFVMIHNFIIINTFIIILSKKLKAGTMGFKEVEVDSNSFPFLFCFFHSMRGKYCVHVFACKIQLDLSAFVVSYRPGIWDRVVPTSSGGRLNWWKTKTWDVNFDQPITAQQNQFLCLFFNDYATLWFDCELYLYNKWGSCS